MSVPLSGLVRISKTRYHRKDLALLTLLLTNLYPASRGPTILLDKSGRLNQGAFKFVGDKKGPTKGFLPGTLEN